MAHFGMLTGTPCRGHVRYSRARGQRASAGASACAGAAQFHTERGEPMQHSIELLRTGPVLLYDGACGVCSAAVQWILRHEHRHTLRFAAIESKLGRELRDAAGIASNIDSALWIELCNGEPVAEIRSAAMLRVLNYVGGPWLLLTVLRFVPRSLRDACYRAFANVRLRVRAPACLIPTSDERARFLGAPTSNS